METVDDALSAFAELVRHWAGRINLVSTKDLERLEDRHIKDSLRIMGLVRELGGGPAVDVGSGAGFPGVPLAIADPSREWRLLEPRAKRAAFLEEAVRSLELPNCEVIRLTADQASRDGRLAGRHVLGTARALAPPAAAFSLIKPLLENGGVAVVFVAPGEDLPVGAMEIEPGIARLHVKRAEEDK